VPESRQSTPGWRGILLHGPVKLYRGMLGAGIPARIWLAKTREILLFEYLRNRLSHFLHPSVRGLPTGGSLFWLLEAVRN